MIPPDTLAVWRAEAEHMIAMIRGNFQAVEHREALPEQYTVETRLIALCDALAQLEKESAHWQAQTHKAVEIGIRYRTAAYFAPPSELVEIQNRLTAALTACLEGVRGAAMTPHEALA